MLEAYFRPLYQSVLVNPIAKWVKHFQPDIITYLACATGVLVAPCLIFNLPILATLLLLLSGFMDALDGTVARINGKTSEEGGLLNLLSNRIVELAVFIGLFSVDPLHRGWLILLMLAACYLCISVFLVIGIFTPNQSQKSFHCTPGLIERAEAFFFFILMIWMPHYFKVLALIFTGLVILTSYLQYKQFHKYKKAKIDLDNKV